MSERRDMEEECEHRFITTFGITDGPQRGEVTMWACQECSRRFYPACPVCVDVGHRNKSHPSVKEKVLS